MRLSILFLCLFFTLNSLSGQSLSGKVMDETGDPLIGASLLIKGTTTGTTTDLDGNFSLPHSEAYPITIDVSYTGFQTYEWVVEREENNALLTLTEGILIGQEVVVSASRKREKIQEAPAAISVISSRKLAASPQVDPVRNLINEPGVQIQQQSAARFNIELRGGIGLFDTNVFPIMDYRSLVGPGIGTFQSDQSGISRIDLDRIEVVRGPGSALYGPGVTSGVVHFITKNPIDHPGTTIELGGGELNTFISAVRHAGSNASKTFGYKINATYNRGDEFTLDPVEDAAQIALFKREIIHPAVSNGIVDQSLPGRVLLTESDLDPDGDGNVMQDHWWNAAINATLEFRPQDDLTVTVAGGTNMGSSVFYNDLGEGLAQATEFWTQAKMQKGGLFVQAFYVNNNGGSEENPTFLYQTGNRSPVGRNQIEGQVQYNFETPNFLNAEWTTGVDYREAINETLNLVYGRQEDVDDYRIFGGYLQGKFKVGNKIDLYAAARYDDINFVDDGAFSPRVAAVFKPDPKHTFRASFNRAISLPTGLDVYIDFPLNIPVPGLFDVWYAGMFEPHEFAENPMIDVTLPGAPDLPFGTPGLPLAIPFNFVNGLVLEQLIPAVENEPALQAISEPIINFFQTYQPEGFTGNLVGINVFNGNPLTELEPTVGPTLTIQNTFEVGYKGLLSDRLGASVDIYRINSKGSRGFGPIGPLMQLRDFDIPNDLGNRVGEDFNTFLLDLLTPTVGEAIAEILASQVTPLITDAYRQGGEGFLAEVPSALLTDIFGAVETSRMPQGDGIVHVPIGLRANPDFTSFRWGIDVATEYHFSEELSAWANYSWVGDVESKADDSPTTEAVLGTLGNTPNNKYRFGVVYLPDNGFRANISFQHNDGFTANAGQFSGEVDAQNLVDASLGYQLGNGLSFDLTATNLFDSEYRALPQMPILGRRVIAKVTYDFGGQVGVE